MNFLITENLNFKSLVHAYLDFAQDGFKIPRHPLINI